MACDAEDCGFKMLNNDEIVTSMQEESDPVDDETDEYEDNNESSKGPSNGDAFSALETAMERQWDYSLFQSGPQDPLVWGLDKVILWVETSVPVLHDMMKQPRCWLSNQFSTAARTSL
ncbi:hypothetical protein TNCV_4136751 [Trichonephila clavipes]|nr:hypothetical protein TNCV_4136751 [Trichonephila clavipes]